jgi:hypothetical protein
MRTLRLAICLLAATLSLALSLRPVAASVSHAEDPMQKRFLKIIQTLQAGSPQFPDTEPPMAEALAQQSPQLVNMMSWLGRLESVKLLRTQQGERVYELWFTNGRTIWGVIESPAGKIAGMRVEMRQHR